MKWLISGVVYSDAWEAADIITDGTDTVNTVHRLERIHDCEQNEVNGYTVTSFHHYE